MEPGQESKKGTRLEKPARGWTQRTAGACSYLRFTDIDAGGRRAIFFKFELSGHNELPQEVYDILNEMKHLDRSPERGGGHFHTNLTLQRSKKYGRIWRLDDDQLGRCVADVLDWKLSKLIEKRQSEKPYER